MANRRDYTNASGYICPTENAAVYAADHEARPQQSEQPTRQNPKTGVWRDSSKQQKSLVDYFEEMQKQGEPKPDDIALKRARQLWTAIISIAAMMDFSIEEITFKAKGDSARYKKINTKIERARND